MSKKTNIKSNERIDLVDFDRISSGYTDDSLKLRAKNLLLDEQSRVLSGFRIQLDSSPGQITVFNGNALDRSGQLLNEESAPEESVTLTLTGATTDFYLEVEFLESESDSDSRMFWDPTFDNGGAPTPDGKEFALTIPTRRTTTWRVVSPVSTTGFEVTTNPDSTRVPLAKLSTDGSNVISAGVNPGLATENGSSTLIEDIAIGAGSIHIKDAVHLAAVGSDVVIDYGGSSPETVTVSSIDRVNGLISFAPVTASAHTVGAIVRNATAGTLLVQQVDPSNTAAQPDKANRFFQGNEKAAIALTQSKSTFGSRNDLNITSEKDYKDTLAGLIQEMKFGNMDPGVTSTAPPSSFSTRPRYFENAGSIAGSRMATVTIGDGTTTFGDFNGTDETPFNDALAALAPSGGLIFVKAGTYTFTSTVSPAMHVAIVGESAERVSIINNVAGSYALSVFSLFTLRLANITFNVGTGGSTLFKATAHTVHLENVTFRDTVEIASNASFFANNCSFYATSSVSINFSAIPSSSLFTKCSFSSTSAINCLSGYVTGSYIDCNWFTGLHAIAVPSTSTSTILVRGGSFNVTKSAVSVSGALTIVLDSCMTNATNLGPTDACVLDVGGASASVDCKLINCRSTSSFTGTSVSAPGSFIHLQATSTTSSKLEVISCSFTSSSATAYSTVIYAGTVQPWYTKVATNTTTGLTSFWSCSNIGSSNLVVDGLLFDGSSINLTQKIFDTTGTSSLNMAVNNVIIKEGSLSGSGDKYFAYITQSNSCDASFNNCTYVPGSAGATVYFVNKTSTGSLTVKNTTATLVGSTAIFVADSGSSEVACAGNTLSSFSTSSTLKCFELSSTTGSAIINNNIAKTCVNLGTITFFIDASVRYLDAYSNIITDFDGDNTATSSCIYSRLLSGAECNIHDNTLDLNTPSGPIKAGLYSGIYIKEASGAQSASAHNNIIRGGSNTSKNIMVTLDSASTATGTIDITNNTVVTGSSYIQAIYVQTGDPEGLIINNNKVSESTKVDGAGIVLIGTLAYTRGVAINNNTITGQTSATTRTQVALYASGAKMLSCVGNSINRDLVTTNATGIYMEDVEGVTISSNSVNPSPAVSINVITATSDKFIITDNAISITGTSGSILPASSSAGAYTVANNL